MGKEAKYIYGVTGAKEQRNFGPVGISGQGEEVYLIPYKDIAAVVSDSPVVPYDSIPKETLVRYLAAHQSVIEQVMKNNTVIPMKFGTMAGDKEDVQEIFKRGHFQFKSALESMDNKIELDTVALWDNFNSVLEEIGEEEEIKRFKEEVVKRPAGEIYEAKIQLGKMVKSMLDKKRDKYAAEILEALREYAEDLCPHELMDDSMIMNAAFLMDRGKEKEFEQKVDELNEKYQETINFRIVGPLPPYSFCTIEVKKIGFETIDEARKILGLGEEVTLLDIGEAHRRLAQKYHPDRNPDDVQAEKQFKKISEAYKILNDYSRHHRYSFREEDVKNLITVKALKLAES